MLFQKSENIQNAIWEANIEEVQKLLKSGTKINNETIRIALIKRNIQILNLIVDNTDIVEYDSHILLIAIYYQDIELIKKLFYRGVQPGHDSLYWLFRSNDRELVKLFLEYGYEFTDISYFNSEIINLIKRYYVLR